MFKKIGTFLLKYISALFYCLYLFTFGFLLTRNRLFIEGVCEFFNPRKPKYLIPAVTIPEITREDIMIQVRGAFRKSGDMPLSETFVINKLIKQYNPLAIFEIGTFNGLTTLNMAANSPEEAKIYTLDLPKDMLRSARLPLSSGDKAFINKEASGDSFLGTGCEKKITQLYGDSAAFDFSPFHNRMDFVFVDGSHAYEYALSDSHVALRLLRNGRGIILWHDYEGAFAGVARALEELYLKNEVFKKARHISGTSLVALIID
jgi:predicted O-methyltransferase YrrM